MPEVGTFVIRYTVEIGHSGAKSPGTYLDEDTAALESVELADSRDGAKVVSVSVEHR